MLYSLATAASMDQKMGSNPNISSPTSAGGASSAPNGNGHHAGHPNGHGQHQPQGLAILPPTFLPSNTAATPTTENSVPMDWNNFQADITNLLQDDLGAHLEHGGNGWAF